MFDAPIEKTEDARFEIAEKSPAMPVIDCRAVLMSAGMMLSARAVRFPGRPVAMSTFTTGEAWRLKLPLRWKKSLRLIDPLKVNWVKGK